MYDHLFGLLLCNTGPPLGDGVLPHLTMYMSRNMRFPTMWYVRPTKAQIHLHIRAV